MTRTSRTAGRPEAGPDVRTRTVGDVMVQAVVSAHEGAVFKEIARALDRNHIETVPVIDPERHVIGVVTASDLLARVSGRKRPVPRGHRRTAAVETHRKRRASTARDLMTTPAVTVTPDVSIAEAAKIAAHARVHTLPVVDEHGMLLGMVGRGELLRLFLRPDEDIADEVEGALGPAAVGLGIDVSEGVVTLTGVVATPGEANRLVRDAHTVPGVVDVHDELDVRAGDAVPSDEG